MVTAGVCDVTNLRKSTCGWGQAAEKGSSPAGGAVRVGILGAWAIRCRVKFSCQTF